MLNYDQLHGKDISSVTQRSLSQVQFMLNAKLLSLASSTLCHLLFDDLFLIASINCQVLSLTSCFLYNPSRGSVVEALVNTCLTQSPCKHGYSLVVLQENSVLENGTKDDAAVAPHGEGGNEDTETQAESQSNGSVATGPHPDGKIGTSNDVDGGETRSGDIDDENLDQTAADPETPASPAESGLSQCKQLLEMVSQAAMQVRHILYSFGMSGRSQYDTKLGTCSL